MFRQVRRKIEKNYIYVVISCLLIFSYVTGASMSWTSPIVAKLQSNTTDHYPLERRATDDEISWLASAMSLGAILGPIIFGKLPDHMGRKNTLFLTNVPVLVAYAIFTFSRNINLYIGGRFLCGLSFGGFLSVAIPYTSELCHQNIRGVVAGSNMVCAYIGGIFSLAVGPYASTVTYNAILLFTSICFAILFYLLALETPFYLISKGREKQALENLERLRGYSGDALEKEFEDIKFNVTHREKEKSIFDVFLIPNARKAFLLTLVLSLLQQLTGMGVITTYSQSFFQQANTSVPSEICALILGVIHCITGLITPLTCDRYGRKTLLYVSSISLSIPLVFLGVYFHFKDIGSNIDSFRWAPIVCLVLCIAFYNTGVSMVPPILLGEMFPMSVKCVSTTLVIILMNAEVFFLTKYINDIANIVSMAAVCWFYAVMCIIISIYVKLFLIETKGKTMNEIQQLLSDRSNTNSNISNNNNCLSTHIPNVKLISV